MSEEKKLMKKNLYFVRFYCHVLQGLIMECEGIVGSRANDAAKQERLRKTVEDIYLRSEHIYSLCCNISGREYIKINKME